MEVQTITSSHHISQIVSIAEPFMLHIDIYPGTIYVHDFTPTPCSFSFFPFGTLSKSPASSSSFFTSFYLLSRFFGVWFGHILGEAVPNRHASRRRPCWAPYCVMGEDRYLYVVVGLILETSRSRRPRDLNGEEW